MRGRGSDAVPVELGLVALAVNLERSVFANGVGALEDPVLPSGQASEHAGEQILRSVEAQIGFHACEGVWRHGHAFLDCDAHFVVPVDVVRVAGVQTKGVGGVAVERLADDCAHLVDCGRIAIEAALQAALARGHRVEAEVHFAHHDLRRALRIVGQHELVDAVGGERDFQQRAGKAGARLDQREQAARGHVQTAEGAAQHADGFAHQPEIAVGEQLLVEREHGVDVTLGAQQPGADRQLVGAHAQDGVVQLARHAQRVPVRSLRQHRGRVDSLFATRPLHHEGGGAMGAVDLHGHGGIDQGIVFDATVQRGQLHALRGGRAVAIRGEFHRAVVHGLVEHSGFGYRVHQAPFDRALAAHAFGGGAEDVGKVVANVALVGHAGQAAGAGQHAEQRHFGQADGTGAVVHQQDLVAGEGELVAAAGAGAVDRSEELQAAVARGVLHPITCFVGELAKVHLPGMAGQTQHENVRAGAEHLVLQAGDHHGAHFRMLEADPVERVAQLNVDAEVVAVELKLIS